MGVCVDVVDLAVRSPASVADAGLAVYVLRQEGSKILDLALSLVDVERLPGAIRSTDRDPGGIVPTILQALEPLYQYVSRRLGATVADYSAHHFPPGLAI